MKPITMTQEEHQSASEDYVGICLQCGEEQEGCKPDARAYECEYCGKHKVYGLEELLMMGLVVFEDG